MYTSLTQRLGALPDETVVLPGHNYGGSQTTIGTEKRLNPMMRFPSMTDFLRVMGGGRVDRT
jgi:glyoxylase-like metal-dependent hydrolase (beta-lactamase superfamily II)